MRRRYRVFLAPPVASALRAMSGPARAQVRGAINRLATVAYLDGDLSAIRDVRRLPAKDRELYRLRKYHYRMLCEVIRKEQTVVVLAVADVRKLRRQPSFRGAAPTRA